MDFNLPVNYSSREVGIVKKLLCSYGFIQCCERRARLFFHYSQFTGPIEHLRLGDAVEFEMTLDRRTGKPIASQVTKIESDAFICQRSGFVDGSSDRVACGFITKEPCESGDGHVACERKGEYFFLPFTRDEMEPGRRLQTNDRVTFRISTDKEGNLRAHRVVPIEDIPDRYRDMICPQEDTLDYQVSEYKRLLFHVSQFKGDASQHGDMVELAALLNQRSKKYSSFNTVKCPASETARPDHLIAKLKASAGSNSARVILLRQPQGPDGTRGFNEQHSIQ